MGKYSLFRHIESHNSFGEILMSFECSTLSSVIYGHYYSYYAYCLRMKGIHARYHICELKSTIFDKLLKKTVCVYNSVKDDDLLR